MNNTKIKAHLVSTLKRFFRGTYPIFIASLLCVIILITIVFNHFVDGYQNDIENQLELALTSAEGKFKDNIEFTESLINIINSQIVGDIDNKKYIVNVLKKYRANPNLTSTFSWTIFSWANGDHLITVDAKYGIMKKPFDLSIRDYIPYTKLNPEKLILGKPVYGSTSEKWMIPGGVGLFDKNKKYLGAMTIGLEIEKLISIIQSAINNKDVKFAIIDQEYKDILSQKAIDCSWVIKNLQKLNKGDVYKEVKIFQKKSNYIAKKLEDHPYYIYAVYDKNKISQYNWNFFLSRLLEIFVISTISTALLIFIYKRERRVKYKLYKAKKEAVKASQSKSAFLSSVSHELQSPISNIVTACYLLKERKRDEEEKNEIIADIEEFSHGALSFIRDLLDIGQTESGNFKLGELQEEDINDIILRSIKLNKGRALDFGIYLKTKLDKDLPLFKCDQRRMKQIFVNLISNSIKYSPANSVINISTIFSQKENKIEILIEDSGFGMTEEQIKIALARYGTIKNNNSAFVDSTGLGLPIVNQLVKDHGGNLIIKSTINIGTIVVVELFL